MKNRIIDAVFEAVFPSNIYCIHCGRIIDKTRRYSICDVCIEKFQWISGRSCAKCGKALDERNRSELCRNCSTRVRFFDKGYSCTRYSLYERETMVEMKARKKGFIGRKLAAAIADRMSVEDEIIDLVVPVPAHPKKERERGFDQAAVIAGRFACLYNNDADGDKRPVRYIEALKRICETAPMKKMNARERRESAKRAYALKPSFECIVKGKNVAVVDDVFTTGSTMDACGFILKKAGAARVISLTFSAGADYDCRETD